MSTKLTAEQIAKKNSTAMANICVLYCEMEAVVETLDDYMDDLFSGDRDPKETLNRAKGLTMVLRRIVRETGRQAGVI